MIRSLIKRERKPLEYIDYLLREQHIKTIESKGFILIHRKKARILAYSLIFIGIITLPLPTGSIFLIILGLSLLGYTIPELKELIRKKIKRRVFLLF
jgi:hypothetical protein